MPSSRPDYTPADWYWIVAGSTTQVYSSKRVAYVANTDPAFLAWKAKGGRPTRIAAEQDLMDVLTDKGIALPAGKSPSDTEKTAQISAMNTVIFKALFNHENRIRTLEGKAALTAAQFIAALKTLL